MTNRILDEGIMLADTVTKLGPDCAGLVVLGGSHGGAYATYLALKARARGVILNDAGRARDNSGIGGAALCEAASVPYATLDTLSCRIGDAESAAADGRVSFASPSALALGVEVGENALVAARKMCAAPVSKMGAPTVKEARTVRPAAAGGRRIVLIDSVSLVQPEDAGQIIITGSHGGVPGLDPRNALAVDGYAAFFHDAGGGKDDAALTRLAALDVRGIIAGTAACMSARVGDGASVWQDGILSHLNEAGREAGGAVGMRIKDFAATLVARPPRDPRLMRRP